MTVTVTGTDGKELGRTRVHTYADDTWHDASETMVRLRASSDASGYMADALKKANQELVCELAPCLVNETRELRRSWSKIVSRGNNAAKHGEWNIAEARWQESVEKDDQKDRLDAMHNLGVYYEMTGKLDQALKEYQAVYAGT